MVMEILLFFSKTFIFFLFRIVGTSHHYAVIKNTDINSSTNWLIESYNERNKIYCLAKCNENDNCATAIFNVDPLSNKNCFLYKKYFSSESGKLLTSNFSTLYNKDCKYGCKKKIKIQINSFNFR